MSPNSEVPVAAPAHPPLATAPASFPETPPAGIRHVVRLCFVTSLISFLVAVGSSQYRHQLTVLGERMGGVNGPFLICLALITLLAGMGLRKRWSGGWNLAVLAGVIGVIAGVVRIHHGGPGTIVAVPLIGLCLAVIGYLLRGPVIIWFRGGPKFTTTSYRRVRGDPFEDLFPAFQDRYEVKREHDLLNYAGGLLVVAYGFVYFISLLGPAREFTSREHRFTISAPPGWVVADVPQTGAVVSLIRPVGKGYFRDQPCVSIYIQPSNAAAEDLSPEEIRAWEQDWVQRASAFVSPTPESMSVAGILGWKITLEHPRGGRSSERWLLAVVKREDRAFTLRCATEASIFEDTLAACASVFEQFQFLP